MTTLHKETTYSLVQYLLRPKEVPLEYYYLCAVLSLIFSEHGDDIGDTVGNEGHNDRCEDKTAGNCYAGILELKMEKSSYQ